ncbi:alpha-L-fucosidase [Chloroflexota bacterium]
MSKYTPTWKSLRQYSTPDWFRDAKFGIFIHWGVYSVPAFGNEWYPRNMYLKGSPEYEFHAEAFGSQTEFGYKDFIPQFKAEKFDPQDWADIFKASGARYVVPVAEHHDGFAMYDSSYSRWNAVNMGPKRDVIGELANAVRETGMIFGLSSHRAENWWYYNGGREFSSDVQDPAFDDFYGYASPGPVSNSDDWQSLDWQPRPDAAFLDDWLLRTQELVDKYKPQLIWFDWWIEQTVFKPYIQKFAAYYYNRGQEWGKGVVINYKKESYETGTAVFDIERGQSSCLREMPWQTDTAISKNSWGYVRNQVYKTPGKIIGDLIDIVSKNGCLLLNVGPKPDGTIPREEVEILREIGRWLTVNGEAIYGTHPWTLFGEGPIQIHDGHFTDTSRSAFTSQDIRFTTKENALFAILLADPGESALIKSLIPEEFPAEKIKNISLLGLDGSLDWLQDRNGLTVFIPSNKPCEHAWVIKIDVGMLSV